jgi:hypothetical protein
MNKWFNIAFSHVFLGWKDDDWIPMVVVQKSKAIQFKSNDTKFNIDINKT